MTKIDLKATAHLTRNHIQFEGADAPTDDRARAWGKAASRLLTDRVSEESSSHIGHEKDHRKVGRYAKVAGCAYWPSATGPACYAPDEESAMGGLEAQAAEAEVAFDREETRAAMREAAAAALKAVEEADEAGWSAVAEIDADAEK